MTLHRLGYKPEPQPSCFWRCRRLPPLDSIWAIRLTVLFTRQRQNRDTCRQKVRLTPIAGYTVPKPCQRQRMVRIPECRRIVRREHHVATLSTSGCHCRCCCRYVYPTADSAPSLNIAAHKQRGDGVAGAERRLLIVSGVASTGRCCSAWHVCNVRQRETKHVAAP